MESALNVPINPIKVYIKQYGKQDELKYANAKIVGIKYPIKMILKTITFFLINNCNTMDVIKVNTGYPTIYIPIKAAANSLEVFIIMKNISKPENKIISNPNIILIIFLLFILPPYYLS